MNRAKIIIKGAAGALAALALCLGLSGQALALEASRLVPVGRAVGIRLDEEGVTVVGLSEVAGQKPAQQAGLEVGDKITRLNGRDISSAEDFLTELGELDGSPVKVEAERAGQSIEFEVSPVKSEGGAYQFGLWLRDDVSGIGTLTFYDPDSGIYGALGHGINDSETGELIDSEGGVLTRATIVDVLPGARNCPGELCGTPESENVLGTVDANTVCGIFGVIENAGEQGESVPVADESEIRLGKASILANVKGGEVGEYDVEITRIYRGGDDRRCLMLQVTDDELLSLTGGIVQGMSGSPIIQDGRLIGAVTHVLMSDPARGYGISIERMLEAAG